MKGLYVHIPFCRSLCTYCDFVKEIAKPDKIDQYMETLIMELEMVQSELVNVSTIYIGGGTPSMLSEKHIRILLETIYRFVPSSQVVECTFECNPEDITPSLANTLKASGVNRISLGVQTFDDEQLKFLNRHHHHLIVQKAMTTLSDAGIDNISIDMIFSLINQTREALIKDLEMLLATKVKHVSWYSLILEEQTRLMTLVNQGKVHMNDQDLEADMYETIIDTMKEHGYEHYEISNFAKDNYQSLHNLNYWIDGDYIGIGAGAHGKVHGERTANIRRIKDYIERVLSGRRPIDHTYPYEGIRDGMLNGLRLINGVHVPTINQRYQDDLFEHYPKLTAMIELGLLIYEDDYLKFTRKGLMLGNQVFSIF